MLSEDLNNDPDTTIDLTQKTPIQPSLLTQITQPTLGAKKAVSLPNFQT